ncbi:MAG TPA: hypothetical protein VFS65_00730 [Candidatus Saccharimonadales bacterium]|nr:hypothetical protein [Candidatus Saccharimonadales bacterium]
MFDPKDPQETITLAFDYSAIGDVVTNPVVTIKVVSGIDTDPSAMLSGLPQISDDNIVLQKVIGGISGCKYKFRCLATVLGNKALVEEILPVQTGCFE